MKEILAVYDEEMNRIGDLERDEIHKRGLWHETVHCWFIEERETGIYIYLQQRADNKADFPSQYDITAAGHIDADEPLLPAALREIHEELGITVNEKDLYHIGPIKDSLHLENFIDNEFGQVFFYKPNSSTSFELGDEVQNLVKVHIDDFEKLVTNEVLEIKAHLWNDFSMVTMINIDEICPHEKAYLYQIIEEARRF